MGIQDMMKQAQEMQERLQREMSELSVAGHRRRRHGHRHGQRP